MKREVYVQEIGAGRYRIAAEDPGYPAFYMSLDLDQAEKVYKQLGELLNCRDEYIPCATCGHATKWPEENEGETKQPVAKLSEKDEDRLTRLETMVEHLWSKLGE